MIGSYEKAAEYFKNAARLEPSNSVGYFTKSALAELSAGNGAKAKEYYEQALKADPDSMTLQFAFGDFLLGNSIASKPFQDLERALELNEGWYEDYPYDGNLLSLYINYILLEEGSEAKKLVPKFKKFKSVDSYIEIAKAYHQLGNFKKEKEYTDLAIKNSYFILQRDREFLASVF
jgi:tetratricopeptide (TPR) repeat protein